MTQATQTSLQASPDKPDDALAQDLIASGAWVLPLVIATFLVFREFKKDPNRGKMALGLLMAVGVVIILVPMFGSVVLVLAMLALIVVIVERLL